MLIKIAKEIVEKYPQTEIGYVIAKINVATADAQIESIKNNLQKFLNENNINNNNYSVHPQIANWRNVFKDFGVSHKTNRSSVEALIKRIVSGSKMWSISNVVDLYNCCSVLSMLPMGGYDIENIKDNIYLRYGKDGENFEPLGMNEPVLVSNKHVVYADEEKVICWLWNFRDSKHTSIKDSTKHAIFFLDSAFKMEHIKMKDALQLFEDGLSKIDGSIITHNGILSKDNPQVEISFENFNKTIGEAPGLFDALLQRSKKMKSEIVHNQSNSLKSEKKETISSPVIPFEPISIDKMTTAQWAIHFAAIGDVEKLKKILSLAPSLAQSRDWHKSTLLMHACVGDHAEVVSYLVEAFPNLLKQQNAFGETAFDMANKFKNQTVLAILNRSS